jgi:serine/threonine protein kinase/ABC-type branched-subunit amino acid transport system ATPase component
MAAFGRSGERGAPAADASAPLLALVGIETSFGALEALRGAHLTAHPGEIVGLCGENGAGKSTLVKILAGEIAHGDYRGVMSVEGREQRFASPQDARRAGIAVIHQKPVLVPQLSVAHNLMLGREPRRYGLVDEARLESEAKAQLARFGFSEEIDPSARVGELGLGLQQVLEIIRALLQGARVLVLEEPAVLLVRHERERLFGWLRSLKDGGTTCLYVSDRLDEIIGLCDVVTVLRDGKTAQTLSGSPPAKRTGRGRYAVYDEIASGGMATVHLGKMIGPFGFTSTVAIKRLHAWLAKDPDFVAMFLDEARLASRVRHPNVVPVLDVYAEEGDLSLVMEYVDGESLSRLMKMTHNRAAAIPVPIAVAIVASVLHGLHAAHEARDEHGALLGLVHRDVSPQNVIVGTDGVVRVIDFGIAKAVGRSNVSREGQIKGKLSYMAPEQIQRGVVNRRTDVYGASVLLWELLTGERLFEGEAEGAILARVLDEQVPAPSTLRAWLPSQVDAITLRGLDRVQERRFETAQGMALELEKVVRPATALEIGEWVQSIAHGSLAERRQKLARLERETARSPAPTSPETPDARDEVDTLPDANRPEGPVGGPRKAIGRLLAGLWDALRRVTARERTGPRR